VLWLASPSRRNYLRCQSVRRQNFFVTFPALRCIDIEASEYAEAHSLQGSLDLLMLRVLCHRPSVYGYTIMSTIKDWSGDVLCADEGSLYPALHRMEEAGWIRAKWMAKDSGRRMRIYE